MSSDNVSIVTSFDVAEHFRNLDQSLRDWENRKNDSGDFDFELGEAPKLIKVSLLRNSFGESIATFSQTPGHEILAKYQEDAFLLFLNTLALSNPDSVCMFVEQTSNYLFGITNDPLFSFHIHSDWVRAKKALDAVYGSSAETDDDAISKSSTNDSLDDLVKKLYRIALVMRKGFDSSDSLSVEWSNKNIERLRRELRSKVKSMGYNATNKISLPEYDPKVHDTQYDTKLLIAMNMAFAEDRTVFTLTWRPLVTIPTFIKYLVSLQEVNMGWCKITWLPSTFFKLPFLRKVFLNNNLLRSLPALSGSPLLEVLDVHNNQLIALPSDIQFLPLLNVLDVSKNQMRVLPETLGACERLQHLNASGNQLARIPTEILMKPRLSGLLVFPNPISNMPNDITNNAGLLEWMRGQIGKEELQETTSMIEDFSKFEKSDLYTDIAFKPRGARETILAHRLVISARAPKLYTKILKLEMGVPETANGIAKPLPSKDSSGRPIIPLNEVDVPTFQLFKFWCYCNTFNPELPTIPILKPGASFEEETAHQQAVAQSSRVLNKVLTFSETYDLEVLKRLVEAKMGLETKTLLPPHLSFESHFKPFFQRSILSDVNFVVEGQRVPAHKMLLCARSSFFTNMFHAQMAEATSGDIVLPDITLPVLHSILAFCYRDEVIVTPDCIIDILIASRLYALPKLADAVEKIICFSLDHENIASIYELASHHKWTSLTNACEAYLVVEWDQIDKRSLSEVQKSRMESLLQLHGGPPSAHVSKFKRK